MLCLHRGLLLLLLVVLQSRQLLASVFASFLAVTARVFNEGLRLAGGEAAVWGFLMNDFLIALDYALLVSFR